MLEVCFSSAILITSSNVIGLESNSGNNLTAVFAPIPLIPFTESELSPVKVFSTVKFSGSTPVLDDVSILIHLYVLQVSDQPLASTVNLDATTDLDLVEFWLKMDKNMNIGINAIKSGLVIIDVDFRNGGRLNPEWTPTYTVKTADGYHLYYEDAGVTYRGSLGEGIDIKHKGYVVAAPSIHPSGATHALLADVNLPAAEIGWGWFHGFMVWKS